MIASKDGRISFHILTRFLAVSQIKYDQRSPFGMYKGFDSSNKKGKKVMRTRMKVVCWCAVTLAVGVIALMVQTWHHERQEEIQAIKLDQWSKDVISRLRDKGEGSAPSMVIYIEKTCSSTNKEVFFWDGDDLTQSYTIDGYAVKDYQCGPRNLDEESLPSWFEQNSESLKPILCETNNQYATTTAIFAFCYYNILFLHIPPPMPPLKRLTWSGATSEEPSVITDFCASIATGVSNASVTTNQYIQSLYGKRVHPSYVKVIPLYSEEECTLVQDIPVIDYEKVHDYLKRAIHSPYQLIPVPKPSSPFPSLNKPYEPGLDKIRIKRDVTVEYRNNPEANNQSIDEDELACGSSSSIGVRHATLYFLVETFMGEAWEK